MYKYNLHTETYIHMHLIKYKLTPKYIYIYIYQNPLILIFSASAIKYIRGLSCDFSRYSCSKRSSFFVGITT